MKTTLTRLDPVDFIGVEQASAAPASADAPVAVDDQTTTATNPVDVATDHEIDSPYGAGGTTGDASPTEDDTAADTAEDTTAAAPPADSSAATDSDADSSDEAASAEDVDTAEIDSLDIGLEDSDAPSSRIRYVGPKVKLEVSVDEETFAPEIDAAFKKISQQVRVPGFRPGRTPRKVLEAQIGTQAGRAQALEDFIPRIYTQALRDNEVDAVGQPEIEVTAGLDSGAVEFEAIVEVRPQVALTGYDQLEIELPALQPESEEIDERIDAFRSQSADLVEVDRPAQQGDRLTIDIEGSVDGEPLPGLSATEYVYELGSGGIVPEVDEHLVAAQAGSAAAGSAAAGSAAADTATYKFSAQHPVNEDATIDFEITVHKVSELVLPELTDDWVDENTEYDTVEQMRSTITDQLSINRKLQATMGLRSEAERKLAELVPSPVPDTMIAVAVTNRIQELAGQLQQRQMEFEQWLQTTGQTPDEFMARLRDEAEVGVKLNLALTAVAQAESISATDEEIEAEYQRLAEANNTDVESLMSTDGSGPSPLAVKSWLGHNKAMESVLDSAALIDTDGKPISRDELSLEADKETAEADKEPTDEQEPTDE